ncbi:glycosyltransferase [candidate division WOR-3 bacterium]|nr:glycosyltransferase [candidate division WOR-3 bacterium]
MGNGRENKKTTLVVHAITKLDLGGAQKIVLQLLTHMKKRGYNVLLICGEGGELFETFQKNNINMHVIKELKREINPIYDLLSIIKITKLLRQLKRENDIIVHTHTPKAGIIVRFSAYFAGIKKIYHTIHGWGFHKGQNILSRFVFVLIERLTANVTKKMIAVSDYVKDIGLKYGIGKRNKYTVIRNGIELKTKPENRKSLYNELGIPENKKIILQVSSLKPPKSPIDFLKIAKILTKRDDLFFIIAGGGELKETMQAYIQTYNLKNVILTGWYDNISSLYGIADICTLTSISEGMPLAVLEAISFNVPLIATNIPPIKEILPHYKYLCPPHDIKCFAHNIRILLACQDFKYDKNNFDINEMLHKYDLLY